MVLRRSTPAVIGAVLVAIIAALWIAWLRRPQSVLLPDLLSTAVGLLGTLVLFEVLLVRHGRMQLLDVAGNALLDPLRHLLDVVRWTTEAYARRARRTRDFRALQGEWRRVGRALNEAMKYLDISADADLANTLRGVRKFVNEIRQCDPGEFIATEAVRLKELSGILLLTSELDWRLFGGLLSDEVRSAASDLDKLGPGGLVEALGATRSGGRAESKQLRWRQS